MLFVEAEPFPAAPLGPYYYIYRHYDFLRRHPGETPPDYYLGYGNKFLGLFSELDLSNRGEDWITAVARDLQEAIESLRRSDPGAFDRMERDGKALRHYAFASHPEIYRRNGFLELSTFDKAKIMALVSGNTAFDEIPEFLEQALGLAGQAVKHPVATALDILDSNLIETPKHIVEELPRPWEWDW